MQVAIWDTYVKKVDNTIMHFDIIVPENVEEEVVYKYGREYLRLKKQNSQDLTAKQCQFCHVEKVRDSWADSIDKKGYYIYEMEGCQ